MDKSIYNKNDKYFVGTIIDYEYKETYITFTIKTPEKVKCNYYLNKNEKLNLKIDSGFANLLYKT